LHLAVTFTQRKLKTIVETINKLNPNIILIGGDTIENLTQANYKGFGNILKNL